MAGWGVRGGGLRVRRWLGHRVGLEVIDDGVLHTFENYTRPRSLAEALEGVDWKWALGESKETFWVCPICERSTSDDFAEHMGDNHPLIPDDDPRKTSPPVPTTAEYVLAEAIRKGGHHPGLTLYTLESPYYRLLNKASREAGRDREAFTKWEGLSRILHDDLMTLPALEAMVYRAVDFHPPASLFREGSVVTWYGLGQA